MRLAHRRCRAPARAPTRRTAKTYRPSGLSSPSEALLSDAGTQMRMDPSLGDEDSGVPPTNERQYWRITEVGPITMTGCFAGSSHRSTSSKLACAIETHPAVPPPVLTCKKIALPLPGTTG